MANESLTYTGLRNSLINKCVWVNSHMQRMKMDPYHTSYTKFKSKQIKDLNAKPKTIKLLEENIGSNLLDLNLSVFWGVWGTGEELGNERQEKQKQKLTNGTSSNYKPAQQKKHQ